MKKWSGSRLKARVNHLSFVCSQVLRLREKSIKLIKPPAKAMINRMRNCCMMINWYKLCKHKSILTQCIRKASSLLVYLTNRQQNSCKFHQRCLETLPILQTPTCTTRKRAFRSVQPYNLEEFGKIWFLHRLLQINQSNNVSNTSSLKQRHFFLLLEFEDGIRTVCFLFAHADSPTWGTRILNSVSKTHTEAWVWWLQPRQRSASPPNTSHLVGQQVVCWYARVRWGLMITDSLAPPDGSQF